ncbi:hypothetical protein DUI87_21711 [Hirundo rustica rustica]|uniref:Uncharacterized protein n=1 Tax=Hirundo rustica rustica TaxID=333673 RepID=A0A3M0K3T3_HIRRU|nr:hypothetical protein DUI87_21711 [Hirundo rustica rustica]
MRPMTSTPRYSRGRSTGLSGSEEKLSKLRLLLSAPAREGFLIAEPDVTAQMDQGEEQEYEALEETHVGEEQVMACTKADTVPPPFMAQTVGLSVLSAALVGDTKLDDAMESLEARDAIHSDPGAGLRSGPTGTS